MHREALMRWHIQETKKRKGERTATDSEGDTPEKQEAREVKKGTVRISLENPVTDDKNEYINAQKQEVIINRKSVVIRNIVFTVIGLALSLVLNLLSFRVPYVPSVIRIDFSAFTELWVGLAVHPVAGIIVVLLKNLLYYLIRPGGLASIPGKIILDSMLIILTWFFSKWMINSNYMRAREERRAFMNLPPKDNSAGVLFVGGFISGIITSFASLLTMKYIQLPILFSRFNYQGYNADAVLQNYKTALEMLHGRFPFTAQLVPEINSIMQGAFVYNVPICIVKYTICAAMVAVLYNITYQIIHKNEVKNPIKE